MLNWLPSATPVWRIRGRAGFATNPTFRWFHAPIWEENGAEKQRAETCCFPRGPILGFSLSSPVNCDSRFLSAWQMYWPTFSGELWHIFLPHNLCPRGGIVSPGCFLPALHPLCLLREVKTGFGLAELFICLSVRVIGPSLLASVETCKWGQFKGS